MEEKALILLEQAYGDYLRNKISADKLCKDISIALGALPLDSGNKSFTVQITKNMDMHGFFGMRIFPALGDSETFCENLVQNSDTIKFNDLLRRWKHIESWVLELDSQLFERNEINFTPKELTAMTLHELGHVIYSERPLERFYRAYKENQMRLKLADKGTQKVMYHIYMIPLSVACMQREWVNGKNELNVEIVSDKTVAEYGYGQYLVEAFDKIIRHDGTIATNDSQKQAAVNTSMEWCSRNVQDVIKRRNTLKDELFYQGVRTKSNYLKASTIIILDKLGMKLRERYKGVATEATVELLNDPDLLQKYEPMVDALEAAKFDKRVQFMQSSAQSNIALESGFLNKRKKVKVELPSQYEVDAISVEVDNITNHHDRMFVLDLIYELLDRINTFEEAISPDPMLVRKWQSKIDLMKSELEKYRQATLAKKTFSNGYKFFVKLPPQAADYEG